VAGIADAPTTAEVPAWHVLSREGTVHELDHDFLWRISKALPERGRIGIFNRSQELEAEAAPVSS
jgi:polyphosphate kinase 2 (PPK2 family)